MSEEKKVLKLKYNQVNMIGMAVRTRPGKGLKELKYTSSVLKKINAENLKHPEKPVMPQHPAKDAPEDVRAEYGKKLKEYQEETRGWDKRVEAFYEEQTEIEFLPDHYRHIRDKLKIKAESEKPEEKWPIDKWNDNVVIQLGELYDIFEIH